MTNKRKYNDARETLFSFNTLSIWILCSTTSSSHSFIRTTSLALRIRQQNVHLHTSLKKLEDDNLFYPEEIYRHIC